MEAKLTNVLHDLVKMINIIKSCPLNSHLLSNFSNGKDFEYKNLLLYEHIKGTKFRMIIVIKTQN